MQQVLILTYFYPPCSLTASSRPYSWASYLSLSGYYPTVITRNWDIPIATALDGSRATGDEVRMEQTDSQRVIYVPYRGNLRDRFYVRYGDGALATPVRKMMTYLEVVLQNFFIRVLPYYAIYRQACELLEKEKDIGKVVITAKPFSSFLMGYALKKKFPRLRWVADYRDDWNTTDFFPNLNLSERLLARLDYRSEKKWVGTASLITTISPYYVDKLSRFTGVRAATVLNGYNEEERAVVKSSQSPKTFTITYNGTLYHTQRVEVFLEGYKQVYERYKDKIGFELCFPGLAFVPVEAARVTTAMKGYEHILTITNRIPRAEVFAMQNRSHAFLMVGHTGIRGVPSSKLYEYLLFAKPVILCPDDGDIIRETLEDTGLDKIADTTAEVVTTLSQMIEDILQHGDVQYTAKLDRIAHYSRREQTSLLAKLLDTI